MEELVAHEPGFRGRKLKIMVLPQLAAALPCDSTGHRTPSPLELMKLPFAECERISAAQAEKAAYLYDGKRKRVCRDVVEILAMQRFQHSASLCLRS